MTATSAAARPPRSWEIQTVAVMVTIGATALLGIILLVGQLSASAYLAGDGASGMSPLVGSVVRNSTRFDVLYLLSGIAYLGAFLWWRRNSRQMLREVVDADGSATRHWAVPAWTAVLVASVLLRQAATVYVDDGPASDLGLDAFRTAIRVVGIGLLLFAVWQIREQIRQTIGDSGVGLGLATAGASAVPLGPPATLSTTDLPLADDKFWDWVRRTATEAGADLALLESTGALAHRWHLIPRGGDLTAVRSALPSGAMVTVFAEPPSESFTTDEADEYHGFLEQSGGLSYQSVRPHRLPAFLARTKSARRWALYPANSPTARRCRATTHP
jgi:hypothetical protein